MYRIVFTEEARRDLAALTARERATVLDGIEAALRHEPFRRTRHRKPLPDVLPPWQGGMPWELRVGELRVFYDDCEPPDVTVRAVRRKPGHRRTKEIL